MTNTRPTLDLDLVWKAGLQPRKSVEPELFALLDAIKNTGKLTEATEQVGMPYRQAWGLITAWSERMGKPLVTKEQGRGTQLTALGERLLWVRERINARLTPHLESAASEVEQELNEILNEPNPALTMFASHDLVLAELREFLRTRPGPKQRAVTKSDRRQQLDGANKARSASDQPQRVEFVCAPYLDIR